MITKVLGLLGFVRWKEVEAEVLRVMKRRVDGFRDHVVDLKAKLDAEYDENDKLAAIALEAHDLVKSAEVGVDLVIVPKEYFDSLAKCFAEHP